MSAKYIHKEEKGGTKFKPTTRVVWTSGGKIKPGHKRAGGSHAQPQNHLFRP